MTNDTMINFDARPGAADDITPAVRRLNRAAGTALLTIAVLHMVVIGGHASWPGWFAGGLRDGGSAEEFASFWAGLGGFAIPGAVFAIWIMAKAGRQRPHAVVGWGLLAWAAIGVWVIGPSGFVLVSVPAALLIIADLMARLRHH